MQLFSLPLNPLALLTALLPLASPTHAQNASAPVYTSSNNASATYTNPLFPQVAADPWMIRHEDYYYLLYTTNDNITLHRSRSLTSWSTAESKLLFKPEPNQPYSTDLWAPELHLLDGKWYVIFTADPAADTPPPQQSMYCTYDCPALNHRMYVLESSAADPWTSTYTLKGQLDTFDQFAIDGTYFQHSSGLYHVYSCWFSALESWPANLCITRLANPWTVASNLTERTVISSPTQAWERTPFGSPSIRLASNEGPQQLVSRTTGDNFIIYSAARSDNPNYCLAQLRLAPDGDPMNAADWSKHDGCVFAQDKRVNAYGVGHASFVQSADGREDWVVYHGMEDPWNGWSARTVRAQKFGWNEDGSPAFGRPGYGPFAVPSGE